MIRATPPLWTDVEAVAATGAQAGQGEWSATGVSIDSRTLSPGDLFVALQGDRLDGHAYVAAAFAAGAAAALVAAEAEIGMADNGRLLRVPDTLRALEALGRHARARADGRIAAVTGSVGKTGTKDALALVLGRQGLAVASQGSLNNHWGAPLSLARLPAAADWGVFELGMNHAGEIGPLTRMVRPHVAVITTIEPAHTEFFASLAAIADAKAEIFEGLAADGTAVLNRDNPFFDRLAAAARRDGQRRIVGFGASAGSDVRMVDWRGDAAGSAVTVEIDGRRIVYRVGAPGHHWATNSLAVLATVAALGADVDRAATALADLQPPPGRGRQSVLRLRDGEGLLIDESYNASPAAMRAAFAVLALAQPGPGGRRIAVLGDMRELGTGAAALHAALAPDLLRVPVDLVFAAGPLMAALYTALPEKNRGGHAGNAGALAILLGDVIRPGDVVLVKGSLAMGMAQVTKALAALGQEA